MISLWLPVVVWMAAIYYGATMPEVPDAIAAYPDTLQHMAGYTVLAILTLRALAGARWTGVTVRMVLLALGITTLHGITVELVQMLVPTRSAELRDIGNDILGASAGLAVVWAWSKIRG